LAGFGFSAVASRMIATPRAIGSSGSFRGSLADFGGLGALGMVPPIVPKPKSDNDRHKGRSAHHAIKSEGVPRRNPRNDDYDQIPTNYACGDFKTGHAKT
jgi:hypothetical protein